LENHYNKLSFTNTFLFSHEKVKFYDVFFPLEIETRKSWHSAYDLYQKINSLNLIESLFTRSKYVAIIGYAGSGKTMLAKHLFLECCNSTFLKKIPIYIELRTLNSFSGGLREYIYSVLTSNKIKPNSKIIERALSKGNFTFILDGYDELRSDILEKITIEIEQFFDEFHKNYFVLTSRPGSNVENLSRVICYYVDPLNNDTINSFLEKQLRAANDDELLHKIIETIEDRKNFDFKSYLSNPLLLSMFILTYSKYPDIPKLKSKFYGHVLDTLITKHDSISKKGGFKHPRKSHLANEDFDNILKSFAYISFFESRYDFDSEYLKERLKFIKPKLNLTFDLDDVAYDLSVSLSVIVLDGFSYRFPHRTLQDYLTILFIKDLDDKAKEVIYGEKLIKYFERYKTVDLNFVMLCLEMDKHSFYKFFAKKIIGDFISGLEGKSQDEIFIQIMKDLLEGYDVTRSIFNQVVWANTPHKKAKLVYSLLYSLEFLKTKNPSLVVDLNIKNRLLDIFGNKILNDIKKKGYLIKKDRIEYLSLDNLPDELILKLIHNYKLNNPITTLIERIQSCNIEIDTMMSQETQNIHSIWDFSDEN
jgi:hypothetical protein